MKYAQAQSSTSRSTPTLSSCPSLSPVRHLLLISSVVNCKEGLFRSGFYLKCKELELNNS